MINEEELFRLSRRYNEKGQKIINIQEIANLYIVENLSMELVAYLYRENIAKMSRIMQKYHLPELKDAYYEGKFFKGTLQEHSQIKNMREFLGRDRELVRFEIKGSAEDLFFKDFSLDESIPLDYGFMEKADTTDMLEKLLDTPEDEFEEEFIPKEADIVFSEEEADFFKT